MIKELSISGFRGFGKEQKINFSLPNGELGSGISFFVGSNNSGKTTILEALRFFNLDNNNSPSIAERKRNIKTNSKVNIVLTDEKGDIYRIISDQHGGSVTSMHKNNDEEEHFEGLKIFVLQSRRFVEYEFHRNESDRYDYMRNLQMNMHNRTSGLNDFSSRLFSMHKKKKEFDPLLKEILGHNLDWTIEQNDNGTYYLKLVVNGCIHSSEGLGDGIWSVFTICDALYDSEAGSVIAIDEPELSLHPAYQRRTMDLLKEYARDRQVIISTHSPYFIDWESILVGAELIRTVKNKDGDIEIYNLENDTKKDIKKFTKDINQPHTLGFEAKEVFFLEDNIILVEGQDDVIFYPRIAEQLNTEFKGDFFGWGVGGAPKMKYIINILKDLGYEKINVILDGDKPDDKEELEGKYPEYNFFIIPADDIRDKKPRKESEGKIGIVDSNGTIKSEYRDKMKELILEINKL
ncbi:ATP-dependent nuclease [Senegalia massiliensis]|uniref:ATP-dependent nuclease n=1 Tax=Senegalia massiliensis TaxID=1720316 RepID=UPI001031ED5D|nr:ATP-binding protein [Senegalia massiliensis]